MSVLTQEKPVGENGQTNGFFKSRDGLLTIEDWAKLPETKPPYELIDGVLIQKMPTRPRHSYAAFRLALQLTLWGDQHGWMFVTEGSGLRVDKNNGFVPDVWGFAPGTAPDGDSVYCEEAYLLAEVHSDSTGKADRTTKRAGYAKAGVQIYLLVHPTNRTIEVFRLENKKYGAPELLSQNDVWQPEEFPGLRLELAQLWMN